MTASRMFASIVRRRAAACAAVLAAVCLAALCAACPSATAIAAPNGSSSTPDEDSSPSAAGPFEVEGPAASYSWDGLRLSITGEGVSIVGMAGSEPGDVYVASAVERVGIGAGVHIGTLEVARSVRLETSGGGNSVDVWMSDRDDAVGGSGSIALGSVERSVDIYGSVSVRLEGAIGGVHVWEHATLAVLPSARIEGSLTVFGGVLDLSQVPLGEPVPVLGVSVGNPGQTFAIAAPFGATRLDQLLGYEYLSVNDSTSVYEDGEEIGALREDGSFLITATRTVTFEGFDDAVLAVEQVPLFGAAAPPEAVAPDGYRFIGWDVPFDYVDEDLTVRAEFEKLPASASRPEAGSGVASSPSEGGSSSSMRAVPPSRYTSAKHVLAATDDGDQVPVLATVAACAASLAAAAAGMRHSGRR